MNKKEFSLSRDHRITPAKGQDLPSPIPELKGLNGGDKQAWHNANLDDIYSDFQRFGPEWTKARYIMSERTLKAVIGRAEKHHRKTYGLADRAYNQGQRHEEQIYQNTNDIGKIVDFLNDYVEKDEARWNDVADFLQLLSIISAKYSNDLRTTPKNSTRLHKNDRANLGSNSRKVERLRSKLDTSCIEVDRYTVLDTEEPGRLQLPGPSKTRLSPRQRYEQSKSRRRRRV